MKIRTSLCVLLLLLAGWATSPASAQQANPSAQTAWRLLDYLAVDYGGAVQNGRVVSASEYAEMREFSAQVRTILSRLPETSASASLIAASEQLQASIDAKATPELVASRAHELAAQLLVAYPTPLAPTATPDLTRAASLYGDRCLACHGARGAGDGPAAAGLEPPPVAFSDLSRARQRSVFGLYQVITQGLDGTAMASFSDLSASDRWALAFYVGRFAYSDGDARRGEQLWRSDSGLRQRFPNLETLTQLRQADLSEAMGENDSRAIIAYLRSNPGAVAGQSGGALTTARSRLTASVAAYRAGDHQRAGELGLSAYLDGFEPIEPTLRTRDAALLARVETAMGEYRAAVTGNASPDDVAAKAAAIEALFDAVEHRLSPESADVASVFVGAMTILLREGLEALLIVVAMLAFLRKAERTDALPYVHGGWIAALAAGGLTWLAATYLVSITGASRELTEGFGSIIAAVVLVSVGIWMHGKSHADAWQKYIKEHVSKALSRGSAWFLFLLAFLVVYREVFETILFYAALWSQGAGLAMIAGVATGALLLALVGWLLLRMSVRLPIGKFFAWSSILIAVLAVVLAGKGVAALQEAGLLGINPLAGAPRIDVIGLYPNWQSLLAQIGTAAVLIFGFFMTNRPTRAAAL